VLICIHNSIELERTRCTKTSVLWFRLVQLLFDKMHNLIPLNQLNGHINEDNDLITEYYEGLIECDDKQSECKRICKEVLIR